MKLSAAEFEANCLGLMDHVNEYHEEVVITKHGKPVAKLVPISSVEKRPLFGFMGGTPTINGDITAPIHVSWNAME